MTNQRSRRRRTAARALAMGISLVALAGNAPAYADQPRVQGCMGADTSAGAKAGINGERRSSIAHDASFISPDMNMGGVVAAHKAGYLGGECAS